MATGFRLVGVESFEATSVTEARKALSNVLERSDVAIVLISEELASEMRDEIDKLRLSRITPLIVAVPGSSGAVGETKISDLITKTLGVRV
jgi:vacuolar-type H+-ATPase subunit F/Vma7